MLLNGAIPFLLRRRLGSIREAFEKIPFIASFGSFIDETSAAGGFDSAGSFAARILARRRARVRLGAHRREPRAARDGAAAQHALDAGRSAGVAQQLGGDVAKALPWKTYEEALKASFSELYKEKGSKSAKDADEFWSKAQEQGGWWSAEEKPSAPVAPAKAGRFAAEIYRSRNSTATPASFHSTFCRSLRRCFTTARSRICRGCRKRPTRSRA